MHEKAIQNYWNICVDFVVVLYKQVDFDSKEIKNSCFLKEIDTNWCMLSSEE